MNNKGNGKKFFRLSDNGFDLKTNLEESSKQSHPCIDNFLNEIQDHATSLTSTEKVNQKDRFIYGVKSDYKGKMEFCYWNSVDLGVGDLCVVSDSDSELYFGKIVCARRPVLCHRLREGEGFARIHRKANELDISRIDEMKLNEKKAFIECSKLITEQNVNMRLIKVHFTFDGLKSIFFFTAEKRVDFRKMVRHMTDFCKITVEFRQVGVRNKAQMAGGCGICGNELCCTRFLNNFNVISIGMAKNQSLALNPGKLLGLCNRLRCCIEFENDQYLEIIDKNPAIKSTVYDQDGNATTMSNLSLLNEKVTLAVPERVPLEFNFSDIKTDKEGRYMVDFDKKLQESEVYDSMDDLTYTEDYNDFKEDNTEKNNRSNSFNKKNGKKRKRR